MCGATAGETGQERDLPAVWHGVVMLFVSVESSAVVPLALRAGHIHHWGRCSENHNLFHILRLSSFSINNMSKASYKTHLKLDIRERGILTQL